METSTIADKTWFVDVKYKEYPRLIACGVLETDAGLLLVDPGPTVSLAALEAGLAAQGAGFDDVHGLLLTHIHLDHAGATGVIVDTYPHVRVYVHRRGARHMIHPERLLASAERIYGDQMDTLWGAFLPTPEANVHILEGGETLRVGGRVLDVAYTPGHAIHHVSYLDRATGTAFTGDTAGMRVTGVPYVIPVTPPPDIHLEAWHESLALVRAWAPEWLFVTHFGPSPDVAWHLDEMARRLDDWAEKVRRSLQNNHDDELRARTFHEAETAAMRAVLTGADEATSYEQMGQPEASWHGLARYWRKYRF
jgi:glyoxylase-like metal-dependent hydrolase (beta-lactamase superfamily II)